jgi:hypothetical protein
VSRDYQIKVEVAHATREGTIALFENLVSNLKEQSYRETFWSWYYGDAGSGHVGIGPRSLSELERIEQLEKVMFKREGAPS